MTHQEILTKAIEKAIAGGFSARLGRLWVVSGNLHARLDGKAPYDIIFNHDFAKALWGDEFTYFDIRDGKDTKVGMAEYAPYKYHLQQMVIAENPIAYLGEHV